MLHDDEVRVDTATVRRLIQEQFPAFFGEEITPIQAGTDNAVFRIGRLAAARFPLRSADRETCADALYREARALKELSSYCPVSTPRPIGLGQPGHGYPMPWAIQSWVEGIPATPQGFSRSGTFARDIANLISALRRADTRGRPFTGGGRGGTLRDHDAWMATCFEKSETLLDVPTLRRLWQQFRELSAPTTLVMCHKDLIPANLLTQGQRLVGVLDGGSFGPADPALDLVAAWHLFDTNERGLLRTQLGCDDAEWQRGAAWAFQQAMGLVWYYSNTHPEMVELGHSTLERIIAACELGSE